MKFMKAMAPALPHMIYCLSLAFQRDLLAPNRAALPDERIANDYQGHGDRD